MLRRTRLGVVLVGLVVAVLAACGGAEAQSVAPTPVVSADEIRKLREDVIDLQAGVKTLESEIQAVAGSVGELRQEVVDFHAERWEFESTYQGIYENSLGLSVGRGNRYKRWVRDQAFSTYAAFIFKVMLLKGYVNTTPETFREFIADAENKPQQATGDALAAFGVLSDKEQRSFLAALPADTDDQRGRFEQELFQGGVRGTLNPLPTAGLANSAFDGPMRRAFELTPAAQEMTFLEYLRRENELR